MPKKNEFDCKYCGIKSKRKVCERCRLKAKVIKMWRWQYKGFNIDWSTHTIIKA